MAKVPKIINVSDINKKNIDFKLLHFTKAQWKKAIDGVNLSTDPAVLPKKGLVVHAIPDPSGNVTVFPGCSEQSPDTICAVKNKLGPDGSLTMQCQCKPAGGGGHGGPGLVTPAPACALQISNLRISCANNSCNGTCRLRGVISGNHIRLFCACT